eukprot:CAMPEP_0177671650 /NCGR_PEP_ID=MMETSP0447-20121125/24846_1 /TAXON_ID=0 /ORGANISM="Stygamoeba regulata, Strain BSH-02190019" /LENGTH=87 /DNA_ID=CAMNT_0019179115 /DNA_START=59 /DNA_END=320 /DNA_ORIENTATION=+
MTERKLATGHDAQISAALSVGATVRVLRGPLRGHTGKVQRVTPVSGYVMCEDGTTSRIRLMNLEVADEGSSSSASTPLAGEGAHGGE